MIDKRKRILVNTSPWIALSIRGQLPLLQKLYADVHIPYGVKEEIMAGGEKGFGTHDLKVCTRVRIEKVIDPEKVKLLYELERGEAEVIILANEKGIKQVLIDERVARLQARVLGLNVIGTLGLLLRAKKEGLLHLIKPSITKRLDKGIWIKDDIVDGILREAKELHPAT